MKTQNAQKIEEGILNLDSITLSPEIVGEIQSLQDGDTTIGLEDDLARLETLFNFLFGIYQRYTDDFAGEEKNLLENLAYIKDLKNHFEIFRIKKTSIVENYPKELVSTLKIVG